MSHIRPIAVTICSALALVLGSVRASAEPVSVHIFAGSLEMAGPAGTLRLAGEQGFTLTANVDVVGGIFGPRETCLPCVGGAPLDLDAVWAGNDLHGTATFQGSTFTQVGSLEAGRASGIVRFHGAAVTPALEGLSAIVVAPFTFEGQFAFPAGSAVTSALLTGAGTATVELGRTSADAEFFFYRSAEYRFDPVPEPGTMVLVGSMLGGLALGRLRRVRPRAARNPRT